MKTLSINTTIANAQLMLACVSCAIVQTSSTLHQGSKEQTIDAMDQLAALQSVESQLIQAIKQ